VALRLLVADTPAERDAARDVEGRVFMSAFGNTPDVMEREYGRYADRSRFVTVIDESDGSALGAARLVLPDRTGEVKTLTDVTGDPWRLSVPDSLQAAGLTGRPVWDVATLAVDRSHPARTAGAEVSLALCHGLFRHAQSGGAQGLVTILDDRVLRLLRVMGVPWTAMAGAASAYYLGSPASTPCVCLVDAIPGSVRTDLAPAIVDGIFPSIVSDSSDLLPDRGTAR